MRSSTLHLEVAICPTFGNKMLYSEWKLTANLEVRMSTRNRFETYTETRGIYWYWLNKQQTKITVISCFQRTDL